MASKPRELTEFGPWSEQKSSSGRKYFYNKDTEVSQWEKPKEWKDHELRLEQERLTAEQRTQPQPPPPPPMLFPPPFPPFSANIPPPPGYPSFPMNAPPPFPPPPFAAAPFAPPPVPTVPPPAVPPPPARVNTHVPPPLVSSQPPALSQPPKTPVTPYAKQSASSQPSTSKQSAYLQKQAATGAGNPPPPPKQPSSFMQQGSSPMLLQQSPYQGSPMNQATTPQQQRSRSRLSQSPQTPVSSVDQKPEVKPHPYATPQPVKRLHAPSVQLTISSQPPPPPQLPTKETENSRTVAETASGKPVKREWEDAAAESHKDHTQQTPLKKCKEECAEEEKVAKPKEPWRRFYDANLASKKKAELKLEEDPEMSDIIMQSLALENKLIAELIKVKQAAAMVAVQEHEVLLCQGKIANLQEQQRTIEQRSQNTPAIDLPNLDDLKRQFSQP